MPFVRRVPPTGNGSLILGIPDEAVPLVREEVEAVAASLPDSELFLGPSATAECLREKGRHCRFIHIATHGYFRRDSPMFSGIRLGDSYFSLYDLYQLKLPAEFVALSGCSTGLNVVTAGRRTPRPGARHDLRRGTDFFANPVGRPGLQYFPVMKYFYGQIANTRNKAQALQEGDASVEIGVSPSVLLGAAGLNRQSIALATRSQCLRSPRSKSATFGTSSKKVLRPIFPQRLRTLHVRNLSFRAVKRKSHWLERRHMLSLLSPPDASHTHRPLLLPR